MYRKTKKDIAEKINILGQFCGKRDIPELTSEQLYNKYNITQADIMVLFGGSIMCGGDILAAAMKNKIAKKYIIVGGEGHTTEILREKIHSEIPNIETVSLSEAEIFAEYLKFRYGLKPDFIECSSTNCGNNITHLLKLIEEKDISFKSIIISQDATMQRRMEAGLKKYIDSNIYIINYAVYSAKVIEKNNMLTYEKTIRGMWNMKKYVSLLIGEISRLSDDRNGYGPCGKKFIAHVEIPNEVSKAFYELKNEFPALIRMANSMYASK